MKKKVRRLRLERETLRTLTPENLERAVAGYDVPGVTRFNSCNWYQPTIPEGICNSNNHYVC